MSYFSLNDNINNKAQIVYNYFSTQVNQSDITTNPDTNDDDTYLKTAFTNTSPTNNLIYTGNSQKNYGTSNLYIFGLLHNNITGFDSTNIVGELVLEHNMSGNYAYSCFFLKKNPDTNAPTNDIDNIFYLNSSTTSAISNDVVLNNIIPTQSNCIVYNSNNNSKVTVFVFMTPIMVNASSAATAKEYLKTTDLFSVSAPTVYNVIPRSNITVQKDEEIYIDCNPSGVSNTDIATYNIPINSELSQEKQDMDYMKTTVNFFVFIVGLAFCYFAIPSMYKTIVVDNAILFNKKYSPEVPDVWKRIRSADIWLTLIVCAMFLTMLILGFQQSNYVYITTGLFICIFYGLSFSILQNSKMDKEFMTLRSSQYTIAKPYELPAPGVEPQYFNIKDYFQLFVQSCIFFVKECIPAWIGVVFMYLFILILSMYFVYGKNEWTNFVYYATIGPLVVLPLLVCIIRLMVL